MKVVICAYDAPDVIASGPNGWVRRWSRGLAQAGVEVRALVIHRGNQEECPTIQGLRLSGIPVHALQGDRVEWTDDRARWIIRQVAQIRPDVFVANLVTPAFYAARWIKAAGIRTVGVLHSRDEFYREAIRLFVCGEESFAFSAVVTVSRLLEGAARAENPHGVQVVRIPCGAPVPASRCAPPCGTLKVLYAGRLEQEQKRVRELTEAFCCLTKRYLDVEATICGSGRECDSVSEIISRAGCASRVHLRGPVDAARVQEEMLRHHVFVMMSDYEGMPVALMEAMACGLVPVCLAEESGVNELVRHGVNGLLVSDRADSFLSAVGRLRSEPGLWQVLSDGARETVAAEYSDDIMVRKWVDLLRALVESEGASRRRLRPALFLSLPPPRSAFGGEDIRRPPLRARMRQRTSQTVLQFRMLIRPRARLRAVSKECVKLLATVRSCCR